MRASTTSYTKCDLSAAEGTTEAIMTAVTKIRTDEVAFRKARMLIGGKWVDSASGEVLEVEDPAHRRPIAEVPRGGAEDVARAVQAAADAFPVWSRTIPRERGRLLARIADALEARVEELARTIALETGNALRTQARPEAKTTVDIIRYFGGLGSELKGETIPFGEHVLSYTRREPLGVVGAIIPWNAPVLLAALKIGPALCAGNTLVLKAAEDAPLGVLMLAEICQEFLPPGVLNVLTGLGTECGAPLDETSDIGTIINQKQFRKVGGYVEEGLKRREARLVIGGLPPKEGPLSEGYYAIPTIFANVANDWRLAREEIFGPVLVAIPWTDEADAIRMATDSHYGLAAYVWSHDLGRALRAAHAIEAGWVQVNQGLGQSPGHSYGGYKESGIGREFSLEGMLESYTQRKNVTINLTH